jgi:hypothetical protein
MSPYPCSRCARRVELPTDEFADDEIVCTHCLTPSEDSDESVALAILCLRAAAAAAPHAAAAGYALARAAIENLQRRLATVDTVRRAFEG